MPEVDRLLHRRIAVAHQLLDIARHRNRAAGILDQLPFGVVERAGMHIGRVRLQRLDGVDLLQERALAEFADADMDGDARADVARRLPDLHDVLGAPPGDARHSVMSWSSLLKYCLRSRAMSPGYFCFGASFQLPDGGLRIAVGEHRAHPGLLQALDAGIGVLGRILDVRPIQHRGDASVDAAQRAEQVGDVGVLRHIVRAEFLLDQLDVVQQRAVRQRVAEEALPHVAVGIDEARHHHAFAGVDHLRVRRADVRLHRGNLLALDQDVGLLEVADGAVERKHAAALDQDRPAGLSRARRRLRALPITLAASAGAAATPAAVVQRNCRRDRPFVGRQHGQPELNGCVIEASLLRRFYCRSCYASCDPRSSNVTLPTDRGIDRVPPQMGK